MSVVLLNVVCILLLVSIFPMQGVVGFLNPRMAKQLLRQHRLLSRLGGAQEHHRKKCVLIAVAEGSEELETIAIADTLVRAGSDVKLASVSGSLFVKCSRGIELKANLLISDPECTSVKWDLIVCPGGMPGAENLYSSEPLRMLLKNQAAANRYIGAICAAPAVVLSKLNILQGKAVTCYPIPRFMDMISKNGDATYVASRTVVDGNIITSQGPGTSLEFALKLVETLYGEEKAIHIGKEMLYLQ